MTDELRKAIADYFDVADLAQCLDITTTDLLEAFPEELAYALDDIVEIMGLARDEDEDDYSEEEER